MGLTCLATITESRPENYYGTMGSLTADQLSSQLKLIKKGINEAQLIADDKVVKIFNDLHMPVNSEILELCSETGHVSACMQTRGYFKIDVLNEDMPTLRKMENKNLYRNYIWREVSGIGSTGLREESYDVVVTSGGFSSDAMSPNDITETLRILRPEGYMIWSMKTAQAEHSTEFGLFEQNLASLVKASKCTLVKHEIFSDKRTKTGGELYVVKRLAGQFPDYLDRPTPKELQEQIEQMLVDDADPGQTAKFYDDWSEKDDDLVVVGHYNGYVKCAEAFLKLGLDHQVSILDLAAGTGLLGAEIGRHGYTNIDGLDSSLGMLGKARSQGIFKNYINAHLDGLGSIPVNDETYDVIAMKDGYQLTSGRFALMDTAINDLVIQKQLEITLGPVVFKNFLLNKDGRFYMMRKLSCHTYACGSPLGSPKTPRKH